MVSVLDSQKTKLRRANDFMAYSLHRKMATDPRNSERYQGMFIQLKIFDAMLKGRPDEKPRTPAQEVKEEKFDYVANVDDALKKHKKESSTQE